MTPWQERWAGYFLNCLPIKCQPAISVLVTSYFSILNALSRNHLTFKLFFILDSLHKVGFLKPKPRIPSNEIHFWYPMFLDKPNSIGGFVTLSMKLLDSFGRISVSSIHDYNLTSCFVGF